jgi:hypothetical protein
VKIAFCVEGSVDRAVLQGLRDRWCPGATLVEGAFRGQLPRSQIPKECKVLTAQGADLVVFLRDANLENWRDVLKADEARCPAKYRHRVIFGVCDRNAECWLAADPDYLASCLHRCRAEFTAADPSSAVKSALGLIGFDKELQEPHVAALVRGAPLQKRLRNKSFEHFYQQFWHYGKQAGCALENLRAGRTQERPRCGRRPARPTTCAHE